jgi:hypothetical protein
LQLNAVPDWWGLAAAFFAAWFLAISGTFNSIAHPHVTTTAGGYFLSLVSSPFIGVASV